MQGGSAACRLDRPARGLLSEPGKDGKLLGTESRRSHYFARRPAPEINHDDIGPPRNAADLLRCDSRDRTRVVGLRRAPGVAGSNATCGAGVYPSAESTEWEIDGHFATCRKR